MDGQVRRYFLGLVSFGVVAVWFADGGLAAVLSLLACAVTVYAPRLLARRGIGRPNRRRPEPQRRPVRTRPLGHEPAPSLPIVPDEPSLIIELG